MKDLDVFSGGAVKEKRGLFNSSMLKDESYATTRYDTFEGIYSVNLTVEAF